METKKIVTTAIGGILAAVGLLAMIRRGRILIGLIILAAGVGVIWWGFKKPAIK